MTDDGRVIIQYWEKWTGFEADAMQEIVDAYNASQSRYFVNYIDEASDQIDTKLLLAIAGGNPPDVAGFYNYGLTEFVQSGALTPLDDLMASSEVSAGDYLPAVIDTCRVDGSIWALPTTPYTTALHYNRALFRQAGLDPDRPPRTIAELDDYARRLTVRNEAGDIVQLGFSPDVLGVWTELWPIWFGGEIWDGEGQITVDSPAFTACLEWARSYRREYGLDQLDRFRAAAENFDSPQYPFFNGRLAMTLQGSWTSNFIRHHAPDLDWAAAPFPAVSESMGAVSYLETDVLMIPHGARNPEGAWDFIRWTQRRENLESLNRSHNKFSPLRESSPGFYESHPNPYIQVFRDLAASPGVRAAPRIPRYHEHLEWIRYSFDEAFREDRPIGEILAGSAREMQGILDFSLLATRARREQGVLR